MDPDRTAELLAFLARADEVQAAVPDEVEGYSAVPRPRAPASPAVLALQAAVVERFRKDRLAHADVLVASFSGDDRGTHLHRFCYAFPGFRADPGGVASSLLELCRPFGRAAEEACLTVIHAAKSKAVAQLLFGFAGDGGGRSRVQLYLQFHGWEAPAALAVAGRMLGVPLGNRLGVLGPLQLLCLDIGPRGLLAAKLYSVIERLPLADVPARVGTVPLTTALREMGVTELRDVRAIHRITGPAASGVVHPAEIDFSLPDNDLHWSDVKNLPPVRAVLERSPEIAALEAGFRLAVRRVAGGVQSRGEGARLEVYYELSEAAPDDEA